MKCTLPLKMLRAPACKDSLTSKNRLTKSIFRPLLCEKCPNMEFFFWPVLSRIWTEYGKIRTRKNFVFGHFSLSASTTIHLTFNHVIKPRLLQTDCPFWKKQNVLKNIQFSWAILDLNFDRPVSNQLLWTYLIY